MNIKRGSVIMYKNDHPSHSWQNGLHVVLYISKRDDELKLARLDKEGNIREGDIACTSIKGNLNILETKLTYKF